MNNLLIEKQTLDSREVAEMLRKQHKVFLADIRRFITYLKRDKIEPSECFIKSTYKSNQNKILPCYQITRKGCEFIASRLTNVHKEIFEEKYIKKFDSTESISNEVLINEKPVAIKELNGQRVITFRDIDLVHERAKGTARKRFNENRNRFIRNEDYFVRKTDEAKKEFNIIAPNGLNVITESGYMMLVKSLNDDLAWKVQRELVKNYFRHKEIKQEITINSKEVYTLTKEERLKIAELISTTPKDRLSYVLGILMPIVSIQEKRG